MTQFISLCEVEGCHVCGSLHGSNSTFPDFPRTDAQVHLWFSMARGSLGHDIKDAHEIKCHRLTRNLMGATARKRKFLSTLLVGNNIKYWYEIGM